MALQDDYVEALNDCIERLASGEGMEAILNDYPTMAQDLRPMLEVGNLFKRVHYPAIEVNTTQIRIAPKIQEAAKQNFGSGSSGISYWPLLGVVLVLGLIASIWQTGGTAGTNSVESSPAAIIEESEIAPEATNSPLDAVVTAEGTDSGFTTVEATEETIVASTVTPEATAISAESTESPTVIVIEGAVEAINANVITIYDMDIVLAADDPVLTVIQLGDVIRVEGEYESGSTLIFIAVTVIFVDVDVVVNEGTVWRDSGNCSNPPPPWAPANGWRRRCESRGNGGGNGNGNGGGRGGSS